MNPEIIDLTFHKCENLSSLYLLDLRESDRNCYSLDFFVGQVIIRNLFISDRLISMVWPNMLQFWTCFTLSAIIRIKNKLLPETLVHKAAISGTHYLANESDDEINNL